MKCEWLDSKEVVAVESKRVNPLVLLFFQHAEPQFQLALDVSDECIDKVFYRLV